jgi:hypothetical protein
MIMVKTDLGQQVMKDRSVPLTPRQRAAFILFDGRRSLDDVLRATSPVGVTKDDIDVLCELGLVSGADAPPAAAVPADATGAETASTTSAATPEPVQVNGRTPAQRYAEAYPIATALTSSLGLRGLRLNLAVEGATGYDELVRVAPRILEAVGPDKYRPLDLALHGA